MRGRLRGRFGLLRGRRGKTVGLVKNRRLMAMQKQQRAKAGMKVVKPCKFQEKNLQYNGARLQDNELIAKALKPLKTP